MNDREKDLRSIRTALWVIVGLLGAGAISIVLYFIAVNAQRGPERNAAVDRANVETTRMRVNRYAADWFTRWSMKSDKPCPDTLLDVARAVDSTARAAETLDAWKQPLHFICGTGMPSAARGIAVYSIGPNGADENGFGDDIRSW